MRYHVGLYLTSGGTAVYQFKKKIDFLNCEILEYLGIWDTTKKEARGRLRKSRLLALAELWDKYPHKTIKRVRIA